MLQCTFDYCNSWNTLLSNTSNRAYLILFRSLLVISNTTGKTYPKEKLHDTSNNYEWVEKCGIPHKVIWNIYFFFKILREISKCTYHKFCFLFWFEILSYWQPPIRPMNLPWAQIWVKNQWKRHRSFYKYNFRIEY